MKKLKVFHTQNIAGVPGLISKHLNKEDNFESSFLARTVLDPFGFSKYYKEDGKGTLLKGKRTYFYYILFVLIIMIKRPKIVHIHAWIRGLKIALFLKKFRRNLFIIYHGHGTEIRKMNPKDIIYLRKANKIFVSTLDLKIHLLFIDQMLDIEFLPNPIDLELFYDKKEHKKGTAFFIRYKNDGIARYDFIKTAQEYCLKHNLELTQHISLEKPIPYDLVADLYNEFEYFLDFKGYAKDISGIFSKAALESSNCGCIVVQEDFKTYTPYELAEYNGLKRVIQYYKAIAKEL